MANDGPQAMRSSSFHDMANNKPKGEQTAQLQSIQKQKNKTGLPDNLKTGMENLSGISIDNHRPEFVMQSKLASLSTNNSTNNTIQREENEAALEEAQGGVPENQQLFVSVIKCINVEGIKGYLEKKMN